MRLGVIALFVCCGANARANLPEAVEERGTVALRNNRVTLRFNLGTGTFDIEDTARRETLLRGAAVACGGWSSRDPGRVHRWETAAVDDRLGRGVALTVTSEAEDAPAIVFTAVLREGGHAFAFRAGIVNGTGEPVQLKRIAVLDGGVAFPDLPFRDNIALLDGRSGGVFTGVVVNEFLKSLNNALVTFGQGAARRSLVLGGLTYRDYEKGVEVGIYRDRRGKLLDEAGPRADTVAYLNLGVDTEAAAPAGPRITLEKGEPFQFSAPVAPEYTRIVFDPEEVVIAITGLDPARQYEVGFAWFDSQPVRVQSAYFDSGPGTPETRVVNQKRLPCLLSRGWPEQFSFCPGPENYADGALRLRIRRNEGPNAIVSDVWVRETTEGHGLRHARMSLESGTPPESLDTTLYAIDPVGRRVDPGRAYLPEDWFYFDAVTDNPFEALEAYGRAVREAQDIRLSLYEFPTVCLWYAMHPSFGDGPTVNDSPGAVAETRRIAESGFLEYSRAAVRLVPDNYGEDNQQGWWDDEHWQRYGSGVDPANVKVEGGHLKPPYETTRKWATEVRHIGGIPLIYMQTGRISRDFGQAFPGYMLHNRPDTSFDFTDPGFLAHYAGVFDNLRGGGVQGLMYDYPQTGWAEEGGFEDQYSTTAAAYRNIFDYAKRGLGPGSFVHERDLQRGSDVALGTVDSQRVWGDTDGITPEMVARGGLRWYKNRVVVQYDLDSKNLVKAAEKGSDELRSMLTMTYVVSSRFLLGNSFARFTPEQLRDFSRVFPFHAEPRSARPVDAFLRDIPRVYDFPVTADWRQLTLYNPEDVPVTVEVALAGDTADGALGLDPAAEYVAYDFWNDRLAGTFQGKGALAQELRPGEARMLSVRRVLDHPQVVSTDRHIMQGYVDLHNVTWNGATGSLTGIAKTVPGEPFTVVTATNGWRPESALVDGAKADLASCGETSGLARLRLTREREGDTLWTVRFSRQ